MKGATQSAARLKQVFKALRAADGKPTLPAQGDPITQVILGVLSRDQPESKAREALERLRSHVVDYNELRVISVLELVEMIGETPDARTKCEDLSRALNRIFAVEHAVSLDRVAALPRKDMLAYLAQIDGLEAYSRARVRLLGFGQHGIPLDEAMWAYARQEEIVDAKCTLDEAQAFLERQVSEEEALEFVALLKRHAWQEMGAAVRKGSVERIRSVPPDRTSRNMLQQVAMSTAIDLPEADFEPPDEAQPEPARKKGARAARKTRSPKRSEKPAPAARRTAAAPRPPQQKSSGSAKRSKSATKRSRSA